jgi:protein SCO1/2
MVNYKILGAIMAIGLGIFLAGCRLGQYEYKGGLIDPPIELPDFELMGTNGQPFHLGDVEGDIALIYFGYTYCPDVCPLTMWEVKKALAELETGQERVHVIFISVDPERDTPEKLANYMAAFGPEFIGLTDDFAKTQEMMKPYGAFAEKEEVEDSVLGYLVNHTARLYLIDPQRRILLQYPFGFTSEDLARDLNYLLQQEEF